MLKESIDPTTVAGLKAIIKSGNSVSAKNIVDCAKALKGVGEGDNPEYLRALVELVGDCLGTTQEGYPAVAKLIGLTMREMKLSDLISQ